MDEKRGIAGALSLYYIAELYPDLKIMSCSDGYAGYFTALSGQADVREMFNSEWMTENIEFNHGSLNSKYITMGDGTHLEGEPDIMRYGELLTIDWCVSDYDSCNHAPVIEMETLDFEAAPGTFAA